MYADFAYLTILGSLLVFAWIEMLGLKCPVIMIC